MTLTDILPSLRRSLPDPMDHDMWPAGTIARVDDLIVEGASMTEAAQMHGTPLLREGDACVRRTQGLRIATGMRATVIVLRVLSVAHHPGGALLLHVDADLSGVPAALEEMRLLGRVSTAHDAPAFLVHEVPSAHGAPFVRLASGLPADLCTGDLLAVPAAGSIRREHVTVGLRAVPLPVTPA